MSQVDFDPMTLKTPVKTSLILKKVELAKMATYKKLNKQAIYKNKHKMANKKIKKLCWVCIEI